MATKVNIEKEKIEEKELKDKSVKALTCGIIMPIATMSPEYPESHWLDVRHIIDSAIKKAGIIPRIVSDSEDSTIIHKSIINNIYSDSIIVCDVSNKNANVMFELGMRLAFNKPVVIIKDDKTGYSFDTSNIQHLGYRKDLRHNTVEKFIDDLAIKIKATYDAPNHEGYQSFLSHFGKFEVATIENKSIQEGEAIQKLLERVTSLDNKFNNLNNSQLSPNKHRNLRFKTPVISGDEDLFNLVEKIHEIIGGLGSVTKFNKDYVDIEFNSDLSYQDLSTVRSMINKVIDEWDLPF